MKVKVVNTKEVPWIYYQIVQIGILSDFYLLQYVTDRFNKSLA